MKICSLRNENPLENADFKFSVNNEGEGLNKKPRSRRNNALKHSEGNADVTVFWAPLRLGHPHSQIPSVFGIPFSYYCSVLGIPRYPPGMPKSLVFWSSPPKKCWISRENRKRFRDGFR